jgi:hypothetical protein
MTQVLLGDVLPCSGLATAAGSRQQSRGHVHDAQQW